MLKNAEDKNEQKIYENYYKYIKKLMTIINLIEHKQNLKTFQQKIKKLQDHLEIIKKKDK